MRLFNRSPQPFAREFPVHGLRARILNGHADSAWAMPQRHGGRNFVYVLAARSTGSSKCFLKIGFAKIDMSHV